MCRENGILVFIEGNWGKCLEGLWSSVCWVCIFFVFILLFVDDLIVICIGLNS